MVSHFARFEWRADNDILKRVSNQSQQTSIKLLRESMQTFHFLNLALNLRIDPDYVVCGQKHRKYKYFLD